MPRCPRCDLELPSLANFCGRCGAGTRAPETREDAALSIESGGNWTHPSAPSGPDLNSLVALDRAALRSAVPAAAGALIAGRYRLVRVIGRGGLGVVYRSFDEADKRIVAVKILLPSLMSAPSVLRRFKEQVEPLRRLRHERIVPVLDSGADEDVAYLVMPLMPGGTLRGWIRSRPARRRTAADLAAAVAFARQVAEGLAHAHSFTVHRDLKPENILLDSAARACIGDFDLAKFRRASPITMTGQAFGTAYYMAPEQIRDSGGVGPRADLFSLGVILFEMLTGTLPVGAFRPPSRLVRGCPKELDGLIERLLAHDPADRPLDAGSVARELGGVLGAVAGAAGGPNE